MAAVAVRATHFVEEAVVEEHSEIMQWMTGLDEAYREGLQNFDRHIDFRQELTTADTCRQLQSQKTHLPDIAIDCRAGKLDSNLTKLTFQVTRTLSAVIPSLYDLDISRRLKSDIAPLSTSISLYADPPPSYDDSIADTPPDYTTTANLASKQLDYTNLPPPPYTRPCTRAKSTSPICDPFAKIAIDFSATHNARQHVSKKQKQAQKKAQIDKWADGDEGEAGKDNGDQDGEGGGGGDGGAGAGGGAGGGGDGGGGDGGGDDGWDDVGGAGKGKKAKKKKKNAFAWEEDEDEQKKKEEEEAKKAEEEATNNVWGNEPTNGGAGAAAGGETNPDDEWGAFTQPGGKKNKKKTKKGPEPTPAPPPEPAMTFDNIDLNDTGSGAPRLDLSFGLNDKDNKSSGFGGFGGGGGWSSWGASNVSKGWGFDNIGNDKKDGDDLQFDSAWDTSGGNKKDKDKKKTGGGFDFGFDSFGGGGDIGTNGVGETEPKPEDEFGAFTSVNKKDKKKKKGAIVEEVTNEPPVIDVPAPPEATTTEVDDWATWGTAPTKKDKKKKKGGVEEVPPAPPPPPPAPALVDEKKDEDDMWASFGSKKDKKKNKKTDPDPLLESTNDITKESEQPPVEDIWATSTSKKDKKKGKKGDPEPVPVPDPAPALEPPKDPEPTVGDDAWAFGGSKKDKKKAKKGVAKDEPTKIEEVLEPPVNIEPAAETKPNDDWDDWTTNAKDKKKKGKKGSSVEPEILPAPHVVPLTETEAPPEDDWMNWNANKKDKKKTKKGETDPVAPAPVPPPEVPEAPKGDDDWMNWNTGKKDKKTNKKSKDEDKGKTIMAPGAEENSLFPDGVDEPTATGGDDWLSGWGTTSATKPKKGTKKDLLATVEAKDTPKGSIVQPDEVADSGAKEDEGWGIWGTGTRSKKDKKKASLIKPPPPVPTPPNQGLTPEPTELDPPIPPAAPAEDDIWGAFAPAGKKGKEEPEKPKKETPKQKKEREKKEKEEKERLEREEKERAEQEAKEKEEAERKAAEEAAEEAEKKKKATEEDIWGFAAKPKKKETVKERKEREKREKEEKDRAEQEEKEREEAERKAQEEAELAALEKSKSKDSKGSKKEEEDTPAKAVKGFWGSFGSGSTKTKTTKEKEKEKKEKEERERKEAEEAERVQKEKEDAEMAAFLDDPIVTIVDEGPPKDAKKKGSKVTDTKAKKSSKSKIEPKEDPIVDVWAPPPADPLIDFLDATAPPPPPMANEVPEVKKADGWSFWGSSLKSSKKGASGSADTNKEMSSNATTNEKGSLKYGDPEKSLEAAGADELQFPSSKEGKGKNSGNLASSVTFADEVLKKDSAKDKKTASSKKTSSVADKVKALQGEKEKEREKQKREADLEAFLVTDPPDLTPPPPPPPVATTKSSKDAKKSSKPSKKVKDLSPEPLDVPFDVIPSAPSPIPGGFPLDDLLVDPPAEPFEPAMPVATPKKSSSKTVKSSTKKDTAKSSSKKTTTVVDSPPPPPAADEFIDADIVVDPKPVEQPKKEKKERPKISKDQGGSSSWGFWGATTPTPKKEPKRVKDDVSPVKEKGTDNEAETKKAKKNSASKETRPGLSRSKSARKTTDKDPADKASRSSGSNEMAPKRESERPRTSRGMSFSGLFGKGGGAAAAPPAMSRRHSTREKTSRRPSTAVDEGFGLMSPPPDDADVEKRERRERRKKEKEIEVNDKAAKVMGLGGDSKRRGSVRRKSAGKRSKLLNPRSRRTSGMGWRRFRARNGRQRETKNQANVSVPPPVPDPYPLDDDIVMVDHPDGEDDIVSPPPEPTKRDRPKELSRSKSSKSKRDSKIDSASGGSGDAVLVDAGPPDDGLVPQPEHLTFVDTPPRRPPLKRAVTSATPRKKDDSTGGGMMRGLFGSFKAKPSRGISDDEHTRDRRRSTRAYESADEYARDRKKRSAAVDSDAQKRLRREGRRVERSSPRGVKTNGSRYVDAEEGVLTDAAPREGSASDGEAEIRRSSKRKDIGGSDRLDALRREKDRMVRDAKKDKARARERVEAAEQDFEAQRREDRRARRREEEARRDADDRRPSARRRDSAAATATASYDRPRADRRRSHLDKPTRPSDDEDARRIRREERRVRREREGGGRKDYLDVPSPQGPYKADAGDKTSSWVNSINMDPPLPPPDQAT
ncbi:MAG: hypothetical protein Q9157_007288, partial [Trypethelium eluteriae]